MERDRERKRTALFVYKCQREPPETELLIAGHRVEQFLFIIWIECEVGEPAFRKHKKFFFCVRR